MKERKNNVNTLLWLMVTLSVMVVFLTLSSCNSSVNSNGKGGEVPSPNPGPGPKTVSLIFKLDKDKGSLKKDNLSVKVKRGNKIDDFIFDKEYPFIDGDEIQIEVKDIDLKEDESIYWELYSKEKTNDTNENVKAVIREGESKNKSFSLKIDSDLLNKANFLLDNNGNISNIKGFVFYPYIEDEMLKFLKEKIGFDRSYKHKRDVIYSTDSVYIPNTLHGASTLGFGKKGDKDPGIYYHGYNAKNNKLMAMNIEEEKQNDEDFEKVGITENFESIRDGLEKRWMAVHKGNLGDSLHYYNANETPDSIARSLISTIVSSYDFGLGSDKENCKLYMRANSASKYSYYMDLRIAFVKKDEPDKGYSVHFCHVNDKKECEPYVLHNAGNSKYTEYSPGAVPKYTESTEKGVHMFELLSLLETSLENLRKKESKEWEYSEKTLAKTLLKNVKDEKYDIYIILGYCRNVPEYEKIFSNSFATGLGLHWCNVLKFGDLFWTTLETKKP